MRKLIVDDLGRFAYFLEVSKGRDAIDGIFAAAKQETAARQQRMDALQAAAYAGDAEAGQELAAMRADDSWQTALGVKAAFRLCECAAQRGAMEALYRFLGPVWEMTPAQVRVLELDEFGDLLKDMILGNDLASFFGAARPAGRSRLLRCCTGAMRTLRGFFRWSSRRRKRRLRTS